ncbi:pectinesterase [Lactuca sativa]|uniref:Pectinesterase n=1 Tax=Lactuca sativa TaxID=4236 RepID=A0A9R1W9I2_LACSA|nr:pectinesterase [Lactuca sativa]KAJ0218475.1 hypothetical protein LSAT_V11C300109570 [Lactuca sativa]
MDCLELYEDAIHHINHSTTYISPTDVEKWLSVAIVNHQACQNGFKDLKKNLLQNFSKSLVDLLADNKPSTSIAYFSKAIETNLVVAQDGSGDFKTITRALKASQHRRTGTDRFVIHVKSGVYKEHIFIKQSMINLTLIGDGIDATVITNNRNCKDGYITADTATVQIWGSGFVAIGITFENTAGPRKQQVIALLSASDLSIFYKCSFKGYQDTLCLLKYRQFYRECDIYGTIDFIFGDAAAVLQNCNIYVRNPLPGQQNTITAQGRTDARSTTGFVMHNSHFTAAPDLILAQESGVGSIRTFLGRPWKDYSRVVFIKCYLDSLIDSLGWMPFQGNSDSVFDKVYYAEYMNTGNGANTGGRVRWPGYHVLSTASEVEQFSVQSFFDGELWIPSTGVPFDSSL